MADNFIDNPMFQLSAYEAPASQYTSRLAEIAHELRSLIIRIEQAKIDIDALLAT